MKILGIDPGTARAGYGLIEKKGGALKIITCGILKTSSREKSARLLELGQSYALILKKHKPDVVAIEKLFFVKNVKTGLDVSQARGVITYLAAEKNIPVLEFSPSEIKLSVAGYGAADKKAVAKMVERILKIEKIDGPDDITDALAAALAAANHLRFTTRIDKKLK